MIIAFAVLFIIFMFTPVILWFARNLARVMWSKDIYIISDNLRKIFVIFLSLAAIALMFLALAASGII